MGCVSSKAKATKTSYSPTEKPSKTVNDSQPSLATQDPLTSFKASSSIGNEPNSSVMSPSLSSNGNNNHNNNQNESEEERDQPAALASSPGIHPSVMEASVNRQRKLMEQELEPHKHHPTDINVNYSMRDNKSSLTGGGNGGGGVVMDNTSGDPSNGNGFGGGGSGGGSGGGGGAQSFENAVERGSSSPPRKPGANAITMASNESFYKNTPPDTTTNEMPHQPFHMNSQGPRFLGGGADKASPTRPMAGPVAPPGAYDPPSVSGTFRVSPVGGMVAPGPFQPLVLGRPPPQAMLNIAFGRPPAAFIAPPQGRGRGAFAFDPNAFMAAQFGGPTIVGGAAGVGGIPPRGVPPGNVMNAVPDKSKQQSKDNDGNDDDDDQEEEVVDDDDDDDDSDGAAGEEEVGEWDLGDQGDSPKATAAQAQSATEADSPTRVSPSKVSIALSSPSGSPAFHSPIGKKNAPDVLTDFGEAVEDIDDDDDDDEIVEDEDDDDDDDDGGGKEDDEDVEDWIEADESSSASKDVAKRETLAKSRHGSPSLQTPGRGSSRIGARSSPGAKGPPGSSPIQRESLVNADSSPKASPSPPSHPRPSMGPSGSPPRAVLPNVISPPKPVFTYAGETSSTSLLGPHPAMMPPGVLPGAIAVSVSSVPTAPGTIAPGGVGVGIGIGVGVGGGPVQPVSPGNAAGIRDTKVVKKKKAELPQQQSLPHPVPKFGDWLNSRTMINNYIILESLGAGSYAEVKLCKEKVTGKLFAMKFINRDIVSKHDKLGKQNSSHNSSNGPAAAAAAANSKLDDIKREIAIMKKLNHPNVLRLYEVMDDPKMNKLFLVLEYMKYGDLMSHQKKKYGDKGSQLVNDRDLHCVLLQVLLGLAYLHEQKIVHGDIKPQNLLVGDNDVVKIADFGISQSLYGSKQKLLDTVGTPAFMAPEMCGGLEYSGQLADVWAVGATVFMLKYGNPPFVAKNALQLFEKIQNDPLVFPDDPGGSAAVGGGGSSPNKSSTLDPMLKDLLTGMLTKDPAKRLTLLQVMMHPWVTKDETATSFSTQQPAPQITVSNDEIENAIDPRDRFAIIVNVRIQMMKRLHHARQEVINRRTAPSRETEPTTNKDSTVDPDPGIIVATNHPPTKPTTDQADASGSMLRISSSDSCFVVPSDPTRAQDACATSHNASSPAIADPNVDFIKKSSARSPRHKNNKVAVAPPDHDNESTSAEATATKTKSSVKDIFSTIGEESEDHRMLSHEETRYRSKMFSRKKPKSTVIKREGDTTDAANASGGTELAIDSNEQDRFPSDQSESENDKEEEDNVVSQSPQSLDELLLTTLSMPPLCKTNSSITPLTIQPMIVKRFQYNGTDSHCFYTENKHMQVGYAVACLQGRRNVQEDRFTVIPDVHFDETRPSGRLLNSARDHGLKQGFVGLYDGHGGDACAQLLQECMHQWLFQAGFSPKTPEEIIKCCSDVDQYLCQQLLSKSDLSGSTGTFVVLNQEMDRLKQLIVGHIGDCRLVSGTKNGEAVVLTTDHRVTCEAERQRVLQLGGNVVNNRVNGVVAVTRAFGDLEFKGLISRKEFKDFGTIHSQREDDKLPALLTCVPDVCSLEIDFAKHHFFLLACDGLWDVMSSQEAVKMVHERLKLHHNPEVAAKELAQEAIRRFSNDNITVVLIILLHHS